MGTDLQRSGIGKLMNAERAVVQRVACKVQAARPAGQRVTRETKLQSGFAYSEQHLRAWCNPFEGVNALTGHSSPDYRSIAGRSATSGNLNAFARTTSSQANVLEKPGASHLPGMTTTNTLQAARPLP